MTEDDKKPQKNLNPLADFELDDDDTHGEIEGIEEVEDIEEVGGLEDFAEADDVEDVIDATPLGSQMDEGYKVEEDDGHDFETELSAMSSSEIDMDADADDGLGDDHYDSDAGDEDAKPAKGGAMKKMLAPALVLVIAAGAAGYIMMNPAILGGGNKAATVAQNSTSMTPLKMAAANKKSADANAVDDMTGLPAPKTISNDNAGADKVAMTGKAKSANEAGGDVAADAKPQAVPTVDSFDISSATPDVNKQQDAPALVPVPAANEASSTDLTAADDAGKMPREPEADDDAKMAADSPKAGQQADDDKKVGAMKVEEVADAKAPPMPAAPNVDDKSSAPALKADAKPAKDVAAAASETNDTSKEIPAAKVAVPVVESKTTDAKASTAKPSSADDLTQDVDAAMGGDLDSVAAASAKPATPATATGVNTPPANAYYDSDVKLAPGQVVGPRPLDPRVEPATALQVVTKKYAAKDQESMVVSANRALKLRRYDAAYDMFSDLYKKNNRDARILMGLAIAEQNTGRTASAIKTYEELLDLDPNNTNAMVNMLGLIRTQYPEVALRRLLDLQEKFPGNAGVAAQIGITEADLGQYDEAIRYLQQAASLDPRNAQHLFNIAIVMEHKGDSDQAIDYYQKALEVDSTYGETQHLPRQVIYDRLANLRHR